MQSECVQERVEFQGLGRRRVEGDFGGGQLSSDGGGLLLREAAGRVRLVERVASCFIDHRNPALIEHRVEELVAQRIFGLALGYEDLTDHETLSRDPLVATMAGKVDPDGRYRRKESNRGLGLASPSTLGRLERTKADANRSSRYEKIVCDFAAMRRVFVEVFIESFEQAPARLVLDIDPTDVEIHGGQEGRFTMVTTDIIATYRCTFSAVITRYPSSFALRTSTARSVLRGLDGPRITLRVSGRLER